MQLVYKHTNRRRSYGKQQSAVSIAAAPNLKISAFPLIALFHQLLSLR